MMISAIQSFHTKVTERVSGQLMSPVTTVMTGLRSLRLISS